MPISEFYRCSIWQFAQAVKGWNEVHGAEGDRPPPMSDEAFQLMQEQFGK